MSQVRISRWKYFSQLIPMLFSAVILLSCRPYGSDIEVELGGGKQDFIVKVKNTSPGALIVDDRLLGLDIDAPIKLEVADEKGIVMPPCSYLDYVATGEVFSVPPRGKISVPIPVSAISLTRCLHAGEHYRFRALLVSEGKIVSRAEWVRFRAEIPGIEANE